MRIAQIDEIGDGAGRMQQLVERHRRGGLEQVARCDEDQFAIRLQVAQTFFDEEEVQVGAPVEHGAPRQTPCAWRNILVANVRRIADDGGKALVFREFEEVHHFCAGRRMAWIDLDAQRPGKVLEEGAVPTRGFKHTPSVTHQRQHAVDNRRRSENLAERGDFVLGGVGGDSWRHGCRWTYWYSAEYTCFDDIPKLANAGSVLTCVQKRRQ